MFDLRNLCIEPEARVVGTAKKHLRFAAYDGTVSAVVENEVILRAELVEREVLGRDAKDERACFRG
jgi:hypothetical protein